MASVASANFSPLVSRIEIDGAIHDALRLFVGRGRRYSVKQLSNGSGVPDRMIESAMAEVESTDFRPLAREYLWSIMQFLGAAFTSELLLKIHQGAFDLPDDEIPPPGEIIRDAAQDTARIAEAAVDGDLDSGNASTLRKVGQRQITRGMDLVALAGGKRRPKLRSVQ